MERNKIKNDLRKMYDETAETYGTPYGSQAGTYFMQRKIKTALFLGSFEKGSHLLEIGCANGSYTFEFVKLGFKMTGLDLSPESIKHAIEKAKQSGIENVEFVVGDVEDLSILPDNMFDGVISFSCLRYVPNPQKAVNEIFRVVKKSKTVAVDFPNKRSPWFNYLKPWLTGTRHIHDHQYTTREVISFLQNADFQDIHVKRILYTPKYIKPVLLKFMKCVDLVGELPILNQFASIIMCGGRKP